MIAGNGHAGRLIQVDATGNVVEGNQIGMIGPAGNGLYAQVGNGAEGVLVYGPSTAIGVPGAGNVISANGLSGIRISGTAATRTIVAANLIGLAPGGGYRFGTASPGNGGDGVRIEDSALNQVGGPDATWANVISSNSGAGLRSPGARPSGNTRAQQPDRPDRRRQGREGQPAGRRGRVLTAEHDRTGQCDLGQPPRREPLSAPRRIGQPGRRQPDRHRHHRHDSTWATPPRGS